MSSPPSSDERESGKDSSGEDEPCGDSSLFLASSAPFSSPTPSPSSPPPTTSPSASSSQTASSSSTSLAPSSPSQNVPKQSSPTLSDRERDMKNLSSSPIASRKEEEEEEEEEKEEEEEEEDEDSEEDEGDEEEEEALVSEEDFQDDPTNNRKLDDFEMMEMVGSGTFGRLWKVRYTETGEQYAMKVLEKKQIISQDMVKHTILEKQVMDKVKHPFLCSLFCCFQTPRHIFLVMDYVSGGTLFYHLRNRPHPFTETETKFYATEILLALRALHDQDYVYRDLKLENILLDEDGHVRITDFGLSAKLTKKRPRVRSFSGSKVNLAPEVFSETNKTIGHGKSVDFWGLGVLLHLLLTHQAPIWHDDFKEHIMLVMYGKEVDFEDFPFLSNEAKSLLSQLLARDPKKRLGCRGETVGKRRKRGRRGGAGVEEVMRHPFFKGVDWEKVERKEFWKRPPVLPAMDFAMISEAELREQNSGGSGESGGGSVDEEEEQERGVCGEVYFSGFRRSMVVPKRRSRRASYRSVCSEKKPTNQTIALVSFRVSDPITVDDLLSSRTEYLITTMYRVKGEVKEAKSRRRYKEFLDMYEHLVQIWPKTQLHSLPPIPPKRILYRFSDDVILERVNGFQVILDFIALYPDIMDKQIRTFLGIEEEEGTFSRTFRFSAFT